MAWIPEKALIRGATFAGGLVPPLFLGLIFGLGALKPEFNHLGSPMSLLGGDPGWRGLAFNSGIGLGGLLVIIFAAGLKRRLPGTWPTRAGSALLAVGGLGLVGVGIFHCGPGCRNVLVDPDWMGRVHILASFLAGAGCGLGPAFLWPTVRHSPAWRDLAPLTLTVAILANLAGLFFWLAPLTEGWLRSVEGLTERLGLLLVFLWMARLAIRLGRVGSPARGDRP
jgi:hypothetical protein